MVDKNRRSVRRLKSAPICRVALLVAVACVAGCAELPLPSRSGSTRNPTDTDNFANFRDLLNGNNTTGQPNQRQSDVARLQGQKIDRNEDLEAKIYNGAGGQ